MSTTLTGNPDLVDPGFNAPPENPIHLLNSWLEKADELNISEPRSLVLSTINKKTSRPSSRVVLLKFCDNSGVIFSTSAFSTKGQEIEKNPIAAGNLWWRETMQQINFQGLITKCSDAISDKIFYERTRSAQAIAVFSQQRLLYQLKNHTWSHERLQP